MAKRAIWRLILSVGLLLLSTPVPTEAIEGACERNIPGNCDDSGGGGGGQWGGGILQSPEERESRREYERHKRYRDAYNEAVDAFNAGLGVEGPHQWASALRKYQQAEADLNRALRIEPDNPKALDFLPRIRAAIVSMQAFLAAEAGRYAEAIQLLQSAGRIYPANAANYESWIPWVHSLEAEAREQARIQAIRAQADAAHDRRDWPAAEALWRQLAAATPDDWAVHYNLGITLKLQGRFEEALVAYREAYRLNPKDKNAREQLEFVEGLVKALRQEQALKQQDAQAAAGIAQNVGTLIQDLKSTQSAIGPTRSELRWVNGQLVEFTTLEHPHSGPGPSTAGEQGVSAKVEGQAAARAPTLEDVKDRGGLTFQTPGGSYGGLPTLSLHSEQRPSDEIIGPYKGVPAIKDLLQERDEARQEYRRLGEELKAVNAKLASSPPAEKGALQVKATDLLDQMTRANNRAYTADLKAREKAQEEARKRKAEQNFSVEFDQKPATPEATSVPSPAPGTPRQ